MCICTLFLFIGRNILFNQNCIEFILYFSMKLQFKFYCPSNAFHKGCTSSCHKGLSGHQCSFRRCIPGQVIKIQDKMLHQNADNYITLAWYTLTLYRLREYYVVFYKKEFHKKKNVYISQLQKTSFEQRIDIHYNSSDQLLYHIIIYNVTWSKLYLTFQSINIA